MLDLPDNIKSKVKFTIDNGLPEETHPTGLKQAIQDMVQVRRRLLPLPRKKKVMMITTKKKKEEHQRPSKRN